MRTVTRWAVVAIVVVHGLIHLVGAAKGLGWAGSAQLKQPIGTTMGVVWLAAAVVVVVTGVLMAMKNRSWWLVGALAVGVSQTSILTSWSDAKAGTLANIVLFAAVVYGYASQGPTSFRAEYQRRVAAALLAPVPDDMVTEGDLANLPEQVATYVRRSGAVGRARIQGLRARVHGRIRPGKNKAWMSFTGEQVNTYGSEPCRLFFMDATMLGLPVDVLHVYTGSTATMRVKVGSLVPMVNAAGPEMDRGETVTLFNDLCVFAPAALVDAQVTWQPVDRHHVRGAFTSGSHTVTAELVFDDGGALVGFVSDDRLRASQDGRTFTPQRWSTPVGDYRTVDSRRVATCGEARWHAGDPEGEFAYVEMRVDELTYNPTLPEVRDRTLGG